jgi:phosphoenolpyruvate carboxylase
MARSDNAPLWGADDQYDRLEELAAGTGDDAKEIPLRRDVRSLGMLLGKVLVEQAGEPLLEVVEQLRRLLIQQREQLPVAAAASDSSSTENTLLAEAREKIARLKVEDAYRVTKAFAIYFELTNLAETNHRKRRRRAAKLHSDGTSDGSGPAHRAAEKAAHRAIPGTSGPAAFDGSRCRGIRIVDPGGNHIAVADG